MTENTVSQPMERARSVAGRAYVPYSHYRVGAVVTADDGSRFEGCNVENAAYGSTICAEANALSTAAAAGVRKITTVHVASLDADTPCYPCGNCLQLMVEFGVESVVIEDGDGGEIEYARSELLPHSFGPEDLPG